MPSSGSGAIEIVPVTYFDGLVFIEVLYRRPFSNRVVGF